MAFSDLDRPAAGTRVRIVDGSGHFLSVGSEATVCDKTFEASCHVKDDAGKEQWLQYCQLEPIIPAAPMPSVTFGAGIGTLDRSYGEGYRKAAETLLMDAKSWGRTPEGDDFWRSIYSRLTAIADECARPEPAPEVTMRTARHGDELRASLSHGGKIDIDTRKVGGGHAFATPAEARALAAGLIALADHADKSAA